MQSARKQGLKCGLLGICLLLANTSMADTKIGVVNLAKLMEQAPQSVVALEDLRKEFEPRQEALKAREEQLRQEGAAVEKDLDAMSDAQKAEAERQFGEKRYTLERDHKALMKDFEAKRTGALQDLQKIVAREIEALAREQSYDLIFSDSVLYAGKGMDITDELLGRLK